MYVHDVFLPKSNRGSDGVSILVGSHRNRKQQLQYSSLLMECLFWGAHMKAHMLLDRQDGATAMETLLQQETMVDI